MTVKKVTYILSDIDKALAFEWVASSIDSSRFQLSFVLLNAGDSYIENFLRQRNIPVTRICCRGKKDWISAWWKTYRYLKIHKPDVVHCHLLQANIIGLSAAKAAGIPQRIYTRHHSTLHHVYHPKGVWWDKLSNRWATDIVAITEVVKDILIRLEKADPDKITVIPHGFDLGIFRSVEPQRIKVVKEKHYIPEGKTVIGVIARYTHWKGIQYTIPAFKKLSAENSALHLVLANARGDYQQEIRQLLSELPQDSYTEIEFENDLPALYHIFDYYVHVPVDKESEAFGQTYIEALASGIPSVFTLSGIACDFIEDNKNALAVPFKNSENIYQALIRLMQEKGLKERLQTEAWDNIKERFALVKMITKLEELYA